ncbi:hypothetical protein [Burkholderia sp. BDU5]|uniref:hypothetical protein n=1 Tax=Burkholderia sp. BDU5 TaxID=1385590 RepID=UPI000A6A54B1|nr:hypothetical protein [Burkholderia sp. BDU5]
MEQPGRRRLEVLRIAIPRALRSLIRCLARIADPLSKWAAIIAVFAGGGWAFYKFAIAGATDWAINLSVSAQVFPYHDNLGLLVIHVCSKNPLDNEVSLDPKRDAYKVAIQQIPEGKPVGTVVDPQDSPVSGLFSRTINMMPPDGYTFLPKVEFDDATGVVVPLGSRLWITAELDYEGDYVVANEVIIVPGGTAGDSGHPVTSRAI